MLRSSVTMSGRRSSSGDSRNGADQSQSSSREVVFSKGSVPSPRLEHGQVLTVNTASVTSFLIVYDSYT